MLETVRVSVEIEACLGNPTSLSVNHALFSSPCMQIEFLSLSLISASISNQRRITFINVYAEKVLVAIQLQFQLNTHNYHQHLLVLINLNYILPFCLRKKPEA